MEADRRYNKLWYAITGGIIVGGWGSAIAYDSLMHLIGRETQGLEWMATLLVGITVGPTVAFIRERRRQKNELQNPN